MPSPNLQSGQVIQVNLSGLFDGQRCICTFHYSVTVTGSPSSQPLSGVTGKWNDAYWKESSLGEHDGLSQLFMPGVTDCTVSAQIVFGPNSRSNLSLQLADPDIGQYPTGNPLTSGAAAVIKRTGSLAGPKWRGRFYTFGLPQPLVTASKLNGAADFIMEAVTARLDAPMVFGSGGNTIELASCLYKVGTAPLTTQTHLTHSWNDAVRYQRRREVGVGQ